MRSLFLCGVLTLLACFGRGVASAQDTAAEEAARRAMVIAQLPPDAAKVLFGRESTPAAGPPQAIGSFQRGCLSERRVQREARAMTRREVITKAIAGELSWVQAAQVLGITPRQMRRLRRGYERWGMSAVMDQRGGRPRRKRIGVGTIAMLCRLKREVYADFSVRHFFEQVSEKHQVKVSYNWLRLMLQEAGVVEREPARGQYRRRRERRPMVGMLVHLDASTHEWIAGLPMQDLVVALDDADGRILYARFFAQEGSASTFAALKSVVRRHV